MSSSAHFPDRDNFQRRSDEFATWLSSRPGIKVNSKIRIADLRANAAGRGVGMFQLHPDEFFLV
jgi:SET domain-containing protein 6